MAIRKKDLPQGVYIDSKGISYHHRDFGVLSRTDEPSWKMWKALEEKGNHGNETTIQVLWDSYRKSAGFKATGTANQKNRGFEVMPLIDEFGNKPVDSITLADVTIYLRKRELEAPAMAYKERKFLQQLCDFGAQLGMCEQKILKSIKIVKTKAKNKVMDAWIFERFKHHAPLIGRLFMEGAYLFAARGQDCRAMKPSALVAEGIFIKQLKTGTPQIKEWNPDVEAWAEAALSRYEAIKVELALKGKPPPVTLLCKPDGGKYEYSGVRSMFIRAKHKVEKELGLNLGDLDFTFHCIKHTSITNFVGEKQKFSGHKSKQVLDLYDHSVAVTPSNVKLVNHEKEITATSVVLQRLIRQRS